MSFSSEKRSLTDNDAKKAWERYRNNIDTNTSILCEKLNLLDRSSSFNNNVD